MKFNNRNITIGENVQLGENVRIGDNTVIYDNVTIGDNSTIANDCVIGEPLAAYYSEENYQNPETVIGANALVRSHTIIYAGVEIGDNFQTGHRVIVRERSKFGRDCHLGTMTDIQGYVEFGDYCHTHSSVHICQHSRIGNYVFIYPFVVFTNDPHPPSNSNKQGPVIGDYTQIAVHAIIHPGVKIGKNCLIGAGANVLHDVPDFSVFAGNPAKYLGDVEEILSKETGESHYPWMNNYDRGMPWEGIGFDKWQEQQGE